MKVSRVLHAGYVFESAGYRIIFDPIFENPFSRNCFAYPSVEFDLHQIRKIKFDAVFISHHHDDHFSLESLQHLDRSTPVYMYCIHDELFSLIRQLGFVQVHSLQTDVAVAVGPFEIIPRLALDSDVDSLFHIQAEGLNILNVVDAWIDPIAVAKLFQTRWDLVLWPFQTMREIEVIAPELAGPVELPHEWLAQLQTLQPRCVVPSSCQFIHEEWSWYRKLYFPISYQRFQHEIQKILPSTVVQRLNPGASIELKLSGVQSAASLPWIRPVGPQDIDYGYDSEFRPPPTGEIARHFATLSDLQKQRVFKFCEIELVEKYNSKKTELDGAWSLILYDSDGDAIYFHYEIKGGTIQPVSPAIISQWVTEVPLAKVYAALEEGESLTSMYVRMQGMPFEEIGEDPLVSTLFEGEIGAYQKAQLQRILGKFKTST